VAEQLPVEIVLATPGRQVLLALDVVAGSSVADVIARSGIGLQFPELDLDEMAVGIWGTPISRDRPVGPGDRVELYRPLEVDPREARRQRASAEKR
jgi:putative ubiquitin-RnfH superfamily antitoxin RatB of RatAB toxin-antitoxin module